MRGLIVLVTAIALTGCTDTDSDGTRDAADCDPNDKAVHPDAPEVCNGIDDNCNGQVDEDVAIVAYWDRDLDGYGDAAFARRVCSLPEDGSEVAGDCDDLDPQANPDALELCDGIDNDCDGEIDEDVVEVTFYADADGDGFGDPTVTVTDCVAPEGYVGNDADCDDNDPVRWTGADELCDGIDNDCDGSVDEDLPDVRVWVDGDNDGSGDPAQPALACGALPGFSLDDRDCDDSDPMLGGGSDEVQGNGVDEDCDGYIDEYGVPVPFATWGDAAVAIGLGTGTEVIQFDDGFHIVNVDAAGGNYTFAGEGCDRTVLYAATADPVMQLDNGAVEGLTLSGGTAASGAGLRIEGGVVRATGVCIEGNNANNLGGGIAVLDNGELTVEDSHIADNRAGLIGGGIYVEYNATLNLFRTAVLGNTADLQWGGGIGVRGGHAEIHNAVVAGNHALQTGGGIYIANGDPGTGTTADGTANISWTTIHGNTVDPTNPAAEGVGLQVGGSTVDIEFSTFSGHHTEIPVISTKSSTLIAGQTRFPNLTSWGLGFRDNSGYDINAAWYLGAVRPDTLGFVDVRSTIPAAEWDLRLTDQSGWIDAAPPFGGYESESWDADDSPGDLGAWGGPQATWVEGSTPLWRPRPQPFSWTEDGPDNDGLAEAWEIRWGTSLLASDGTDDPDGDGLDNLAEQALYTDPMAADTDLDGIDDGTEDAAGTDPRLPADNRPVAQVGPDAVALLGSSVVLSSAGSADINGDALSKSWSVVDAPIGSTAGFVDPTAADGEFVPDVAGLYTVALTVSDGQGEHTTTRWVDARTGVVVPDDAASLQEAVDLTYDGQGIFVRAGTWGPVDLSGRALAVVGIDPRDQVVLDGGGFGPVVTGDSGSLILSGLTLTNGDADVGGAVSVTGAVSLTLRDLHIHGNVAGQGGGIYVADTPLDAAWLEVHDNVAGEGGGLWGAGEVVTLSRSRLHNNAAWHGGALFLDGADALLSHPLEQLEIQSNFADQGAALWIGDTGQVLLDNSAVAGNKGPTTVFADTGNLYSLGVLWIQDEYGADDAVVLDGNFPSLWRPHRNLNGGDDTFWYQTGIAAARSEPLNPVDAMALSWIDDHNPDNDILLPRPSSPMVDAGWPDFTDVDGSVADIGLSGGALASATGVRSTWDSDGDGMVDVWEELWGLDPLDPSDAAANPDGDGWTNLEEFGAGTDPGLADTDGDGIDDDVEATNGTNPTTVQDLLPVAAPVLVGSATWSGQLHTVDGSASYDPLPGPAPLTYAWRVVTTPSGSTVTTGSLSDPTAATAGFVPDVRGRYVLGLEVSDGNLVSHEAILEVDIGDSLRVPSVYPTYDDALLVATPGDRILLEAGIHDLRVVDWPEDVLVTGEGVDLTFVHGLAGWPAFEVDSGEVGHITDLTVAGSNGTFGGGVDCSNAEITLERVRFEFNVSHDGGAMSSNHCDATLVDVDFLDNDASGRGGALFTNGGDLTWTRGIVGRNSSDGIGGGLAIDNTDALIRNVVFHHNRSDSGGGAINQVIRYDDLTDPYDDPNDVPERLDLEQVTVVGNDGLSGALYLNWAEVINSIIQENNNYGLYMSNSDPEAQLDMWFNVVHGNDDGPHSVTNLAEVATTDADAHFIAFDPLGEGYAQDFHLPLNSPVLDSGWTILGMDPDGSLPDPGAYGGPDAPTGWDDYQFDTDGDGMADAWELANGLDPDNPSDASNDADLDGWSNVFEHGNLTDPNNVDTDNDGIADPDELLAGSDPIDDSDNRPVADAGPDVTNAAVGVQRGFNSTGFSFDPNGDAITGWQWTLADKPGRSTLTDLSLGTPNSAIVTLTPDVPGTYVLALVVSANGADSVPDTTRLVVNGTVLVPEDYDNVDDAVQAVADGSTVDIAAGTWPTRTDFEGKDVTLLGAGQDQTVLDGEGMGTVLYGDNGETVTLSDLTVANGMAARGGGIRLEGSGGVLNLTDVTVRDSASIYGGGIYIRNGLLQTTRTRIVDNVSGRNGGAVYGNASTIDLFQTLVAGNLSTLLHGAGVHTYNSEVTVTNSIFDSNTTPSQGGALYVDGITNVVTGAPTSIVYVDQTTFTRNVGEDAGGAIRIFKADVTLRNVLLVDNTSDVGGAVEVLQDSNELEVFYSLASGNLPDHYALSDNPALVVPADGDANGNLVDRAAELTGLSDDDDWTNDDWSLGVGSEAIDAGDPAVTDVDASPADIGAFGGPDGAWTP